MRKYLASVLFTGCALASVSAAPPAASEAQSSTPTVAVQHVRMVPGIRDEAAMVLVGTALIALGAAVRRAA